MGVFSVSSIAVDHEVEEAAAAPQQQKDLDAGALFVLKSKGITPYPLFSLFFFIFYYSL